MGYSPRGSKELDMTEHAHTHAYCTPIPYIILYSNYTSILKTLKSPPQDSEQPLADQGLCLKGRCLTALNQALRKGT